MNRKKRLTCNGNPKGPNPRRTVARRAQTLAGTLLLGGWLGAGALAQSRAPFVDGTVAANLAQSAPRAELIAPDAPAQRIPLPPTVVPLAAFSEDGGPRRTGYVEARPAGVQPALTWQRRPNGGMVLRLEFTSQNARGLRVQLRGALDGLELRVYEPDGAAVFGPYTDFPGVWDEGQEPAWWTPTIYGESLGLEFHRPPGTSLSSPMPELSAIAYLYDSGLDDESQTQGSCLQDATCFPDWATEARGVAGLGFIDAQQNVVLFCSGALLNRDPSDQAPILMTARHCVNTQARANTLEVVWSYQTDTCNGTVPDLNTRPRNTGALLLKTHRDSDWTLLGLFDPPRANTFTFLGWDSDYWSNFLSFATGIHHARGQQKRIHSGLKTRDTSCFSNDGIVQSNQQWYVQMTQGAARKGASGSPAFDVDHRVRGTMSCGPINSDGSEQITCPPDEWKTYGRFDAFFPIGRWYLFQMASPVFADRNFVGDPGNDGDRERGTPTNPFVTVYKATFCVRSGDTIHIRAGNYNERFTLSRPMTLRALGGTVTIGQ